MKLKRRGQAFQPLVSSYGEFKPKEKRLRRSWLRLPGTEPQLGIGLATQPGID